MIKTKNIYDPVAASDGVRALVMRFWPRGVKKEKADKWFPELGPSAALIKKWKSGEMTRAGFKKAYLSEYAMEEKRRALEELKAAVKSSKKKDVTILCSCREEDRCHRSMLKKILEGA